MGIQNEKCHTFFFSSTNNQEVKEVQLQFQSFYSGKRGPRETAGKKRRKQAWRGGSIYDIIKIL